jgi:hypothetical protein
LSSKVLSSSATGEPRLEEQVAGVAVFNRRLKEDTTFRSNWQLLTRINQIIQELIRMSRLK